MSFKKVFWPQSREPLRGGKEWAQRVTGFCSDVSDMFLACLEGRQQKWRIVVELERYVAM